MNAMTILLAPITMLTSIPAVVSGARARLAMSVARERHDLGKLDAHLLKDIGVSAADAAEEASRPLWDLPRDR